MAGAAADRPRPRGRGRDRGRRRGRDREPRRRARGPDVRAAVRPLPLLPGGSREPVSRCGGLHGRRHDARRHDPPSSRRRARPPSGPGVVVRRPRGGAGERRDPGDRAAGARPRLPAGVRRDHRSDVCDAPRKRSPWRVGRRLRLRRRRPGGDPRGPARLRRAADRRRSAAGQAGDGARDGRDPRRRSGRRRSRRADPGDRPGRRRPRASRRSASLPSPTRRSARYGTAGRPC